MWRFSQDFFRIIWKYTSANLYTSSNEVLLYIKFFIMMVWFCVDNSCSDVSSGKKQLMLVCLLFTFYKLFYHEKVSIFFDTFCFLVMFCFIIVIESTIWIHTKPSNETPGLFAHEKVGNMLSICWLWKRRFKSFWR